MMYTYIPINGSGATIDLSIFTWIGFVIALLIVVFGAVRTMRADGNPLERQKGVATVFRGATLFPAVVLFIEIPHMLFF